DLDVLTYGHGRECRRDLESAPNSQPPDRAWFLAGGVLAQQIDAAAVRHALAVEHVEAGTFPRAIGPDQRKDFACPQFERYVAHGMYAAVGFRQALDRQQCGDHAHSAVSMREVRIA